MDIFKFYKSFSKANNNIQKIYKQFLKPFNLTPVQLEFLSLLWQNDKIPSKFIQNELNLDSSTVTGILDRLEKKGLLTRKKKSEDKRTLEIALTKKGTDFKQTGLLLMREIDSLLTKNIDEQDINKFINIFHSLSKLKIYDT